MLFIIVTLLTAISTALSWTEDHEQLGIAEFPFLSDAPPSLRLSNGLTTFRFGDGAPSKQALHERDVTFGYYSRAYTQNHLRQWIFGNGTSQFNISFSDCIKPTDVAGVYQFMNGSNSTTANVGDIYTDLGYQSTVISAKNMIAHTLVNAQAAYADILIFLLKSIFCNGDSSVEHALRRQLLFRPDGQILTLILRGAGALVPYFFWSGNGPASNSPGVEVVFGGIATLNLIVVVGIIDILSQAGVMQPFETALLGTVFVAKARDLILRATQSGRANQAATCLPVTQLEAAVVAAGSGSAPDQSLGVIASEDVPAIQAACANPD